MSTDQPVANRRDEPAGLGWALLAVASALPFVVPPSGQPWPEFYRDAAMAMVWAAALLVLALRAPAAARWPWLALGCCGIALVPLAQGAGGLFTYPRESVWPALYLAGFSLAVAAAALAQQAWPLRSAEALMSAIAIAAIISVGLALAQWARLDPAGLLVFGGRPSGQPSANLGQPNLLATLLLWGVVAIWWAFWRRRIGTPVAVLAVAFLLAGVVVTQSRTGLLGAALLALLAWTVPAGAGLRPSRKLLIALALALAAAVLSWSALNTAVVLEAARTLASTTDAGKRPLIWQIMADAALQRPWAGHGWNQGSVAHVEVAAAHAPLHGVNQHAHNLLLDLLVWNGLPLGALLGLALVGWFGWRLWHAGADAPQRLLLTALAVFGLHAMLELPHSVALMLVPVALMVGTVEALAAPESGWGLPRWFSAGAIASVLVLLCWLVAEYRQLETNLMAHRLRQARIGDLSMPPAIDLHLLQPLQQALEAARVEPREGMPAAEIEALDRSARRYPAAGALFRAAQVAALNGRPQQAASWLQLLCRLHPPASCEGARQAWQEIGESRQPMLLQVPFGPP